MLAARIHQHGDPSVLILDEVAEPAPGPRDLLVRMLATSVNHRDLWMRRGHPHPSYRVTLPAVLGIDVCGVVLACGEQVEGFAVGDRSPTETSSTEPHSGYLERTRYALAGYISTVADGVNELGSNGRTDPQRRRADFPRAANRRPQ